MTTLEPLGSTSYAASSKPLSEAPAFDDSLTTE